MKQTRSGLCYDQETSELENTNSTKKINGERKWVYWLYNESYSETRGVYVDESAAVQAKTSEFGTTTKLERVPFYGDWRNIKVKPITFGSMIEMGSDLDCHILRYPAGVYSDQYQAELDGLRFVLLEHPSMYTRLIVNGNKARYVQCNFKWLRLSGVKIPLKFDDDEMVLDRLEELDKEQIKQIWELRINGDCWNTKNHIERYIRFYP